MLQDSDLPGDVRRRGFALPAGYQRVQQLQLTALEPWTFVDAVELQMLRSELRQAGAPSTLVPFARRMDTDAVAAFDAGAAGDEPPVVVVGTDLGPNGQGEKVYGSFWIWFRQAVEDMIGWSEAMGG